MATASLVNKGVGGELRPFSGPKGVPKADKGVVARPKLDDIIDTKFKGKKDNQVITKSFILKFLSLSVE